jgi:Kyakuja-Dileera-Zisupton transposase
MRPLKEAVISYDIACQYSRKFEERFAASPALEVPNCSLIFAVPKFHLPAHKDACRYLYSFNYLKNVGRTDGEAIERFWSRHNFLSGSTRKMSPETRLDTLNAHFSDWNWRKLCGMGESSFLSRIRTHTPSGEAIQSRLIEAQEQVYAHNTRFTELKASLTNADVVVSNLITQWLMTYLADSGGPKLTMFMYQCVECALLTSLPLKKVNIQFNPGSHHY